MFFKGVGKNKFKSIFQNTNISICKGISKNGNKCTRKASDNSKYCKTHNYLSYREQLNNKSDDITENVFVIEKNNSYDNLDIENMDLKLINDSFYYTDNNYIYDKDSLTKVGYIYNNEYILTDDPFILFDN